MSCSSVWVRVGRGVMRVSGTMVFCLASGLVPLIMSQAPARACPQSASAVEPCATVTTRPSTAQIVDQWSANTPTLQSDGVPLLMWSDIADPPAAVTPFAVAPSDTGISMRASTNGLKDYQTQKLNRRIDESKSLAPKNLALPKAPVRAAAPLDLWTKIDLEGTAAADVDRTQRTSAGADYTVTNKTKVGVAAERSETESIAGATTTGDEKVSAYVAVQAFPALSFDAIGQWQAADTVAPDVGLTEKSERSSVTLAPRVAKSYTLGSGDTIAPFITYKREIDMATSGAGAVGTLDTAGAGVTFAKPDDYSFSLTTDIEGIGAGEPANVNSKVQLKLPFK